MNAAQVAEMNARLDAWAEWERKWIAIAITAVSCSVCGFILGAFVTFMYAVTT